MRFLSAAIFLSFTVSSSSVARAESLAPPCGIANLLAYQQMDGSCSVGILNFSGFGFSASGTGDALLDSASQILVTPATNGFNFSQVSHEPFTVDMGQTANYTINYNFVIDPAPVLDGAGMSLDPPFGNVTATQFYCNDGFFGESAAGAP
ncbi:MAG TPA: hypothetical protein VHB50_19485, partial [Bryobacteraceae bacterium]|nr:hypothetical protein [Bryobacteraceae bacterium]